MFGFIRKIFFTTMSFFSCDALKCVSMNNRELKIRAKIIDINNDELIYFEVNKCIDSCNNINDPYAKLCVPDVGKNINVKVFNPMSITDATRHKEWYELVRVNVDKMQVFVIKK